MQYLFSVFEARISLLSSNLEEFRLRKPDKVATKGLNGRRCNDAGRNPVFGSRWGPPIRRLGSKPIEKRCRAPGKKDFESRLWIRFRDFEQLIPFGRLRDHGCLGFPEGKGSGVSLVE